MRVAFVGTVRGQSCANIMWFQCTTSSAIAQADLDTWLSTLAGDLKTRYQAWLPADYSFLYAKAVCFTPGGGELVSTYTPVTWAGTVGSSSPIGSACATVSWQSGVYWRGGKPRTYFPIGTSSTTGGVDTLAAGTRTGLSTASTNFNNDANALTSGTITSTKHGFVSFRSGNAERGTPLFFAIVGAIVHPRVTSQRRRLGKWQN